MSRLDLSVDLSHINMPGNATIEDAQHGETANSTSAQPQAPRPEAQMTALAIVELLENILSHVSLQELKRARLVSKAWKNTIGDTENLIRIAFTTPHQPRELFIQRARPSHVAVLDRDIGALSKDLSKIGEPHTRIITSLHPKLPVLGSTSSWGGKCAQLGDICVDAAQVLASESGRWKKQYLTQPPCTRLILRVAVCHITKDVEASEEGGITLGDLYAALEVAYQLGEESLKAQGMTWEYCLARYASISIPGFENGRSADVARARRLMEFAY